MEERSRPAPDRFSDGVRVSPTRIRRYSNAPSSKVDRALIDPRAIEKWRVHDGVPRGLSPADNEVGWNMARDKLAAVVEEP